MILIQLLGGLVAGVYSDDPAIIGNCVMVADLDIESYDGEDLVDIFGDRDKVHLHGENVCALSSAVATNIEAFYNQ